MDCDIFTPSGRVNWFHGVSESIKHANTHHTHANTIPVRAFSMRTVMLHLELLIAKLFTYGYATQSRLFLVLNPVH